MRAIKDDEKFQFFTNLDSKQRIATYREMQLNFFNKPISLTSGDLLSTTGERSALVVLSLGETLTWRGGVVGGGVGGELGGSSDGGL